MNTRDLIQELEDAAEVERPGTMCHLLSEAAEEIALQDERICIMQGAMDGMQQHIRRLQRTDWMETILLIVAVIVITCLLGQR